MPIKVAACQMPDIRGNVERSVQWIKKFTSEAEDAAVSLICFPECFLQGYLTDKDWVSENAIDLSSSAFFEILRSLEKYTATIVFGLIEKEAQRFFNTAVIVQRGKLVGKYRKNHLLKGERIFTAGHEYPVFNAGELKFGINICYDTQFCEGAAHLARQGASLILCPANNMMRYQTAEEYKHLHHDIRMKRVLETGLWLVSSDVTGESGGRISYGPTSAIDPNGRVVSQVPLLQTGMITVEI